MLFLSLKRENIQKEIDELEEQKELLIKEINKKLDEKNILLEEVNRISNEKNALHSKIRNRENFFIKHELMAIDTLTGLEFEEYFAKILLKLGYDANVTKASGDDGGDIIASKDNVKYVFQCKNYSDVVGNKAVQEVYTAKDIHKCDKAIVITNNYFTKQAKKEAEILCIELWNRDVLLKLLYEAFEFDVNNIDKKIYLKNTNKIDEILLEDDEDDEDPKLEEAIEEVIEYGQASTSFIQRRLKLGYARSGRILDQMAERGIISGYQGSKPREVLITKERWQELKKNL